MMEIPKATSKSPRQAAAAAAAAVELQGLQSRRRHIHAREMPEPTRCALKRRNIHIRASSLRRGEERMLQAGAPRTCTGVRRMMVKTLTLVVPRACPETTERGPTLLSRRAAPSADEQ